MAVAPAVTAAVAPTVAAAVASTVAPAVALAAAVALVAALALAVAASGIVVLLCHDRLALMVSARCRFDPAGERGENISRGWR